MFCNLQQGTQTALRVAALVAAVVVLTFTPAPAYGTTVRHDGGSTRNYLVAAQRSSLTTRADWRRAMHRLAVPGRGCFTGSYPALNWRREACHTAPAIPFGPSPTAERRAIVSEPVAADSGTGPTSATVGNGSDYSAQVTSGSISTAAGSVPYVSAGASETGVNYTDGDQDPNTFTLQLNTNFIAGSAACDGAADPQDCLAWQQFVYSATYGGVFMQYWLINYDATCPAGWYGYGSDCYTNSDSAFLSGALPTIQNLEDASLTGTAQAGGNDSLVLDSGTGSATAVDGPDSVIDLGDGAWTAAEFAVVGDGDATEATFSPGTTVDVETSVDNGASTAPTCLSQGFTGETNNLSFGSAPGLSEGSEPAIETQQTTGGDNAGCSTAAQSPVAITNPGAQIGAVGTPVSLQQQASDSASTQAVTWTANGLPAGLSISSSGEVSGTPTQPGISSVTITATDALGYSDSVRFDWSLSDTVTITNPGTQTSTVGRAVSLQVYGTDSGNEPLTYSDSGLPPGLSMSSSGLITGVPSMPETDFFTITATDASGASSTVSLGWQVRPQSSASAGSGSSGNGTGSTSGVGTTATTTSTSTSSTATGASVTTGRTSHSWKLTGRPGHWRLTLRLTHWPNGVVRVAIGHGTRQPWQYSLRVSAADSSLTVWWTSNVRMRLAGLRG